MTPVNSGVATKRVSRELRYEISCRVHRVFFFFFIMRLCIFRLRKMQIWNVPRESEIETEREKFIVPRELSFQSFRADSKES